MSCSSKSSQLSEEIPPSFAPLLPQSQQSQLDNNDDSYTAQNANDESDLNTKIQIFTFQELADATDNFNTECLLDVGSFGKVYRGKLREIGETVAVEKLDRDGSRGAREFLTHVLMLSLHKHPNLITLIGYCVEGDERFLVHEYLPLGSLHQLLHGNKSSNPTPLDWNARMKIAAGIAKGLEFLHITGTPPVIYRNLSPSNILLDSDFNAKLSDFGISKIAPFDGKNHVSVVVKGTSGYIAPEYEKTGLLTMKADVYSFGVVLLELVTGRRAVDITSRAKEQTLASWVHQILEEPQKISTLLADPLLEGNFPAKGFNEALAVAAMCLEEEHTARPMMSDVVTAIMYISSDNFRDRMKFHSSGLPCLEDNDMSNDPNTVEEQTSIQSQNTDSSSGQDNIRTE